MMSTPINQRINFTLAMGAFAVLHLTIETVSGGVVTHHLLARGDMPGISNWWGLLLLPSLAWFLYPFIPTAPNRAGPAGLSSTALFRLGGAVAWGGIMSASWELGNDQVPAFMMGSLLLVGIVTPLYRAELILGMIIGMVYTFGSFIPTIASGVVALASLLTYSSARFVLMKIKALSH
jgi:hypothetical protein